ncbi:hypothetical protein [Pseudomonas mucidolens]|uniref:hypothetical protein n=1 Tax=Pseudomonas mucidolens TaxID=46679 RepID=UPI0030DB1C3A
MSFFLAYTIVMCSGALIGFAVMLYAEYRKLDELESYFSENEKVRRHKRFWRRKRRIDRFHRMGLMIDFLSNPKPYLQAGLVTEIELAAVPLTLKRWALWPYRFAYVWAAVAGIWYFWGG